jgi:hypothetical protein
MGFPEDEFAGVKPDHSSRASEVRPIASAEELRLVYAADVTMPAELRVR